MAGAVFLVETGVDEYVVVGSFFVLPLVVVLLPPSFLSGAAAVGFLSVCFVVLGGLNVRGGITCV